MRDYVWSYEKLRDYKLIFKTIFPIPISAHSLLAGGKAGGFEWTVRCRLLFSKGWSHSLAGGSTNIFEMDQEEQGREEPCVSFQVLPLTFPLAKPELAILTTGQSVQWPLPLAIILPSSLRSGFLLGSTKAHEPSEEVCLSAALQEGSLPEIFPSP